ncbi:hypothetical protein ASG49_04195 [Marmoricola sp. Leaf446]|uniref:hypothetical protein n=1 Tax=Marmoricola sp. Leaf446 TaxID=1736379 RepID=UPI0007001A26|nr:hypothetical protein [Marmoricola sp. Leaf446]KQT94118.1 hypothetical protein ASG49_04195 [Marmoricola sp. Leaf446]
MSHDPAGTDETPTTASSDASEVSTPPGVTGAEDRSQPGLAEDTGLHDEPAADSAEDSHGGTIDVDDEQPGPSAASERTEETAVQQENTEASTEQPSQ